MSDLFADRFESPLGDLWAVVDPRGALVQLDFHGARNAPASRAALSARYRALGHGLTFEGGRLGHVRSALGDYFSGRLRAFELEVAPQGTAFQLRVWEELRRIPYGETRTYGELAAGIGRPAAARAVGRANATNPVAVVVPCHRVIGATGQLTGYAGGIDRKQGLLALEAGRSVALS